MKTEYIIQDEKELDDIGFDLVPGDRIFFYGDLGAGKSTYIRHILRQYMEDPTLVVRSPTYTYYQQYQKKSQKISQKQEIRGRKIFSKGAYDYVSNGENNFSNDEVRNFSEISIYHCDLYRLEDYSTWVSIGGEEIAQDPQSIILIEWPEILGDHVKPTKKISIELMEDGSRRVGVGY